MLTLSIETSCDETSLAFMHKPESIPKYDNFLDEINSYKVLASLISSQIKLHQPYGGVVPEIGARAHAEQIHMLMEELLEQVWQKNPDLDLIKNTSLDSKIDFLKNLDYIFVTTNPGLPPALKVGVEFAKTLSYFVAQKHNKIIPVVPINHLHGHLVSCFYQN